MTPFCESCDGCGQVSDDDDHIPWTEILKLPLGSSAAVILGLIKPIPCPECQGAGMQKQALGEEAHGG